jgi:stage V sporulation protein G
MTAMRITDVKIVCREDEKLKAFATITIDHCFVVRGLKIIQSTRGLFVAMPARRKPDGTFQDVAHPIHAAARAELERIVIAAYLKSMGTEAPEDGNRRLGAPVPDGEEEFPDDE